MGVVGAGVMGQLGLGAGVGLGGRCRGLGPHMGEMGQLGWGRCRGDRAGVGSWGADVGEMGQTGGWGKWGGGLEVRVGEMGG